MKAKMKGIIFDAETGAVYHSWPAGCVVRVELAKWNSNFYTIPEHGNMLVHVSYIDRVLTCPMEET